MHRADSGKRFEHIVFPREEKRRLAINLAPTQPSLTPSHEICQATWTAEEMRFVAWLLAKADIDVRHYRAETLQRRLPACLRTVRATGPENAQDLLEQNPAAIPVAISALLVGVTSFFRDPLVFDQLQVEIERFAAEGKTGLNVWSIGCSEGAELYSLAMIVAEYDLLQESCLLGTDCRSDAIEHARKGIYENSALRHVPADFCERYFERNDKCSRISAIIRQFVRWRVSSILGECEPGLWDIIFFRNTALYLRPDVVVDIWAKLENALRPGGLLVLGRAERPNGVHRMRAIGPCVYRRYHR